MNREQKIFDLILCGADRLGHSQARSDLLAGIADVQSRSGRLDEALKTVEKVPGHERKRTVLTNIALHAVEQRYAEDDILNVARTLLAVDSRSSVFVGRLAQMLLEQTPPRTRLALRLIELSGHSFESQRNRYDFILKLIQVDNDVFAADIDKQIELFDDENYRDWSRLALMKTLAERDEWNRAAKIAEAFARLERRSWALFELSRIAEKAKGDATKADAFRFRAAEILQDVSSQGSLFFKRKHAEVIRKICVQFRVFGRSMLESGWQNHDKHELAMQLLEQGESLATEISPPFERLKALLFLARVLRQSGQIPSVRDYVDLDQIASKEWSPIQRSRLFQWTAEAERGAAEKVSQAADDFWLRSVREVVDAQNLNGNKVERSFDTDDFSLAERLLEIAWHFSLRNENIEPCGNPDVDARQLSGEEFETYYFSPFAVEDCGC